MEQLLKQFGFSHQEILVYKTLLRRGGAKVSDLARETGQIRTSCQEYVRNLETKGFINSAKLGNKYFYQAEDPDKIRQMVNERLFVVDRLVTELEAQEKNEPWEVRSLGAEEAGQTIKRAKRKELQVVEFGSKKVGGALVEGKKVVLFSGFKELPAVEIISKEIVELHERLLHSIFP